MATTYATDYRRSSASTVSTVAVSANSTRRTSRRKLGALLWTIQGLLALVFLMTGGMKVFSPDDILAAQSPLPVLLARFIGLCELAGACGLILPGLLRIQPRLTPIAASCLTVLMVFATILTPILMSPDVVMASMPASVGVLAACVAYARFRLAPLRSR